MASDGPRICVYRRPCDGQLEQFQQDHPGHWLYGEVSNPGGREARFRASHCLLRSAGWHHSNRNETVPSAGTSHARSDDSSANQPMVAEQARLNIDAACALIRLLGAYISRSKYGRWPQLGVMGSFVSDSTGAGTGYGRTGAFGCSSIMGYNKFLLVWSSSTAVCVPLAADRCADNPRKFGLALPISLIVLYFASKFSSRAVPPAFLALMALSVAMSFRSWILVLGAAFLVYLFAVRSNKHRQGNVFHKDNVRKIASVSFLVLGMSIAESIFGDVAHRGYLRTYAQSRAQQSIALSGNRSLGSRAEWGGALALIQSEPLGIGAGIRPSGNDWTIAVGHL